MAIDRKTWLAVALIGVIFLSGFTIGVVVDRTWLRTGAARFPPPPMPFGPIERRLDEFRERLALTDDQVERIRAVLIATRDQVTAIHERFEPDMRSIRNRSREAIRAILTDPQVIEYDRMSAEFDHRFKKRLERMRRGGPRGRRDPGRLLDRLDANGDGALSRDECRGSDHPFARRALSRFDDLDTDGNGSLSRDELRAMKRGKPGPWPPDP